MQPFIKGRQAHSQTFSSLLFSLCFSLCLSELPSLCLSFSLSLSLCFFSEWSLCSLEHRSHRGQRFECKRSDVPQRSGRKKDVIGKAPITSDRSLTIFNKQWQRHGQSGQSCDSTNILQPTNISARQKENPTTVPQWFELQMLCRCHSQSGFHSVLVMHVCWFNVAGFC